MNRSAGLGRDAGWITGGSYVATKLHAFLYRPGTGLQDLNALIPAVSSWELEAGMDVNINGQICGYGTKGGLYRGFIYRDGAVLEIPPLIPPVASNFATALNNLGWAVGGSPAFVHDPVEGSVNLNHVIPSGSGWTLTSATDLNDQGWIVGSGSLNGVARAFLLKPVNSPGPGKKHDFNADGKADVLLRHPSTGDVILWLMK